MMLNYELVSARLPRLAMVAAVLLVLSVLGQPLATKASEATRKRLRALGAGASQLNSGRALKLLTFLVGQCHDDRDLH
jgi:hypothetical protein